MGDDFNDLEAGKLIQGVHDLGVAVKALSQTIKDLQVEIKENRKKAATLENRMNRWIGFTAGSIGALSFVIAGVGVLIKLQII